MDIQIRPMTEADDLEKITDWYESIGDEWLFDFDPAPRQREDSRQQLQRWMRGADGNSCILVAELRDSREVIGFATCLLQVDANTNRTFGTIHAIHVEESRRERGYGRALKDAADEWCRQRGAAFMKAYIGIGNQAMLRVCKLLGYQPWMVTWIRKFD